MATSKSEKQDELILLGCVVVFSIIGVFVGIKNSENKSMGALLGLAAGSAVGVIVSTVAIKVKNAPTTPASGGTSQ